MSNFEKSSGTFQGSDFYGEELSWIKYSFLKSQVRDFNLLTSFHLYIVLPVSYCLWLETEQVMSLTCCCYSSSLKYFSRWFNTALATNLRRSGDSWEDIQQSIVVACAVTCTNGELSLIAHLQSSWSRQKSAQQETQFWLFKNRFLGMLSYKWFTNWINLGQWSR